MGTPESGVGTIPRTNVSAAAKPTPITPTVPEVKIEKPKEIEKPKDTRRASSPVEIIPVPVKVEVPEYVELEDTSSGPSFEPAAQDVPQMSPMIQRTGEIDSKVETDSYSSNQGDSNLPGSNDGMPPGDFSKYIFQLDYSFRDKIRKIDSFMDSFSNVD